MPLEMDFKLDIAKDCAVLQRELENSFTPWIFAREFLVQVFFPFNLPAYLMVFGKAQAVNQFLLPGSWDADTVIRCFFISYLAPLLAWLFLVIALTPSSAAAMLSHGIGRLELMTPFYFFFTHRLCICTKYAFLTPNEYGRFLAERNKKTVARWGAQMQVLSGWMEIRPEVALSELDVSSTRNGVNLGKAVFSVPPREAAAWKDYAARARPSTK